MMRDRPDPNLMNIRTRDSHYPWTRKWGAGHRQRRDTHFADPRPLSGYHAVAGRFDEVGSPTVALSPWRLVT